MRTWKIHKGTGKRYIQGSMPYDRTFTTIGKQTKNHAKLFKTQHNRMYSLYIGSMCNVAFPMARFTCIVTSQVFVEI